MTRIVLVHEHPLFRIGVRSFLEQQEGMKLVGSVGSSEIELEHLLKLITARHTDVVLFDGSFTCQPALSATEVVEHIRRASTCGILTFAPSLDEADLFRFMMAGANAYELPTISEEDLREKIQSVANGEYVVNGEVLHTIPAKRSLQEESMAHHEQACPISHGEPHSPQEKPATHSKQEQPLPDHASKKQYDRLTARELALLKEILKGQSNIQAARALGMSGRTMRGHMTSIFRKYQVPDRTAAVVAALRRGVISLDDARPSELDLDKGMAEQHEPETRIQELTQPSALAASA